MFPPGAFVGPARRRRMRARFRITVAAGLLSIAVASGARTQESHAPPAKIDIMPHPANGIDPVAEFSKGVVALEAKQYPVAADALEKATRTAPEHYDSWGFLGAARAGLGDWTGSRAAYEQMLRIEPTSAHGHAGLALALAALKDKTATQLQLDWMRARLSACTGKCTDRVLLQTMIPNVQGVLDGAAMPKPMAQSDEPRRQEWG